MIIHAISLLLANIIMIFLILLLVGEIKNQNNDRGLFTFIVMLILALVIVTLEADLLVYNMITK